jgi:hypothetical protein
VVFAIMLRQRAASRRLPPGQAADQAP